MSGLNRWASAALVTVGAGCLVGAYTLITQGTPAVAETQWIKPITVVATPAALSVRADKSAMPVKAFAAQSRPQGPAHLTAGAHELGLAQPHAALESTATNGTQILDDGPLAGADDADGIEPANLTGHVAQVALETPAAAWMRRLVIARELLREGAFESGRQTLERIIGEASVCRAYQFALVDLAAVELQRGEPSSARQLLDEARGSNRQLALDGLTRERMLNLEVMIQARTQAAVEAAPIELQ